MYVISQAPAAAQVTFAAGASTVAAATGVFNVIAGEPGAGAQLSLSAPGSNRLNGQPFRVRTAGYVTFAAGTYTSSVSQQVYASTTAGFTAAAASAIYTTAAASAILVTVSAATAKVVPFVFEAVLSGDSVSGLINGQYIASINNGAQQTVTPAALVQSPSSINFATEPPLQFAAAIVVGQQTNSYPVNGATANLTQFQIEA